MSQSDCPARVTRRTLLRQVGLAAGTLAMRPDAGLEPKAKGLDALRLEPFVDRLFLPRVLAPASHVAGEKPGHGTVPLYKISMREQWRKLHRDLPATRVWSYGGDPVGPLIEATEGEELLVEWKNNLPTRHFLPIDYTLHGSGRDVPESRTVVHVHGGRTPAASDGYPEAWFTTGQSHVSRYPNTQSAAMLWYHDHAMGTNRLNLYAGLMGIYLVRDREEAKLNLPCGDRELPLMLCDRLFDTAGQLLYPVSDDPAHPWVDSLAGDAMLVNGRVQPFFDAQPCRYRLRIVNAANSRFFFLSLSSGADMHVIGADQGFLQQPVALKQLLLAPGERVDLLVDFTHSAGQRIVLRSGAFSLMQFRVSAEAVADTSTLPSRLVEVERIPEEQASRTRQMTLNEFDAPKGQAMVMLLNRTPWHMPVTETVKLDTTEIWELVNLTDETHPIHLHHVRFQVLDRRPFDRNVYLLEKSQTRYTGPAMPPRPHELGWKDVVQCPAGVVTRIIIPFSGYPGRYVWHCHLQEHEANDMMRPFDILP